MRVGREKLHKHFSDMIKNKDPRSEEIIADIRKAFKNCGYEDIKARYK